MQTVSKLKTNKQTKNRSHKTMQIMAISGAIGNELYTLMSGLAYQLLQDGCLVVYPFLTLCKTTTDLFSSSSSSLNFCIESALSSGKGRNEATQTGTRPTYLQFGLAPDKSAYR